MSKVTIQIDSKWARIVRSPLYWIVATLQGFSISFAPLFLYWSGSGQLTDGSKWIIVPSCFAVIFLVGIFYIRLGGEVVRELKNQNL